MPIVFGAGDRFNKAVIVGKSPTLGGCECNIVGLKDGDKYNAGETIDVADIECLYETMYFTQIGSMKAFANALNEAIKRWENEDGV